MPPYIFDSSVWIHAGRYNPADIPVYAASIWANIDILIQNGDLHSPEEVLHELQDGYDALAVDLQTRDGLFVPLTPELQQTTRRVLAQCPSLFDPEGDRNRGDPFVVGLAVLSEGVVVTGERPRRAATGRLKIPDACGQFGIRYVDWYGFLREQAWGG
jgi:hypothetical protein